MSCINDSINFTKITHVKRNALTKILFMIELIFNQRSIFGLRIGKIEEIPLKNNWSLFGKILIRNLSHLLLHFALSIFFFHRNYSLESQEKNRNLFGSEKNKNLKIIRKKIFLQFLTTRKLN